MDSPSSRLELPPRPHHERFWIPQSFLNHFFNRVQIGILPGVETFMPISSPTHTPMTFPSPRARPPSSHQRFSGPARCPTPEYPTPAADSLQIFSAAPASDSATVPVHLLPILCTRCTRSRPTGNLHS